jgi:hypothetical protein
MTTKTSEQLRAELINLFYGIDPRTLFVGSVTVSRGGVLTCRRTGKQPSSYRIRGGKPAYDEIVRVFGLTDLISISPANFGSAGGPEHASVSALKERAEAKRKAAGVDRAHEVHAATSKDPGSG